MASSIFSSKAIGFRWGNDEIWDDFGTFRFKKPTAMDFHLNSCVLPGLESFPSQSLLTKRIAGWIWYILGVSVNGVFWHQTSFEIWQILWFTVKLGGFSLNLQTSNHSPGDATALSPTMHWITEHHGESSTHCTNGFSWVWWPSLCPDMRDLLQVWGSHETIRCYTVIHVL